MFAIFPGVVTDAVVSACSGRRWRGRQCRRVGVAPSNQWHRPAFYGQGVARYLGKDFIKFCTGISWCDWRSTTTCCRLLFHAIKFLSLHAEYQLGTLLLLFLSTHHRIQQQQLPVILTQYPSVPSPNDAVIICDMAGWSMQFPRHARYRTQFCEFGLQTSHTCAVIFSVYGVFFSNENSQYSNKTSNVAQLPF